MPSITKPSIFARWVLVLVFLQSPADLFAEELVAKQLESSTLSQYRLSLKDVLSKIKDNDLTLGRLAIEAKAYEADALTNDYLPDPVLFAAAQNLPTDTFDIDQEAMTQLRFGVRQMFPKGDSLSINKQISGIKADLQNIKQDARWRQLKRSAELAWLEAWYWQRTIELIEEDRVFLDQVLDFIQSLYQVGAKDQSDLIGAQLELIKLEEKHIDAERNFQKNRDELNTLANESLPTLHLDEELVSLDAAGALKAHPEFLISQLLSHPKITAMDEQAHVYEKKVSLSEQAFEPTWGVEVSYGLRDGENMDGSDRTSFFSAGVSVQYPLFTQGKQTNSLIAAKYRHAAAENQRLEALQQARFQVQNLQQQFQTTNKQRLLYENEILPTLAKQKQSALQSYESDKGDFRLVAELYRKEQSTKIKHQRLRVNEQRLLARINYWIGTNPGETTE